MKKHPCLWAILITYVVMSVMPQLAFTSFIGKGKKGKS